MVVQQVQRLAPSSVDEAPVEPRMHQAAILLLGGEDVGEDAVCSALLLSARAWGTATVPVVTASRANTASARLCEVIVDGIAHLSVLASASWSSTTLFGQMS